MRQWKTISSDEYVIDNSSREEILGCIRELARSYTPEWQFDVDDPDMGSVIALLFTDQLQDTLSMVANALRVGFSFMQAFELISREMDAPMGREVQLVVNEVNLGNTLESALDNMQRRVASPDFELVVTAVLIQRQVGGDLASILDTISETIAERVRMRREVMTLTAQGRASGWVLVIIPFALSGVIYVISPGYLDPLLTTEIGHVFIAGAVLLELIGIVVIRRIVDIKI